MLGLLRGLIWNEQMNLTYKGGDPNSYVGDFGTIADPFGFGIIADVSVYSDRLDSSSQTYIGSTQDVVHQFEITSTIGYVLPPIARTAGDSVALQVALNN